MAHFSYTYATPSVPPYLLTADITAPIIPPQNFIVIPSADAQLHLYWDKHVNTDDSATDLYAEIWRCTDMENWELKVVRQWLNYDYYTDGDVLLGRIYYYKLRFVRQDVNAVVTAQSDYTVVLPGRVVSGLSFEPRDAQANKFFNEMLNNLPGTRIYDRTTSATYSANEQLWQTACRIVDSFKLTVDGSIAHEEPSDATALYTKRNVSFVADKKHVAIQGTNTVDGSTGGATQVNSYLIHTFIQAYAQQFMVLYEQYLQIVADKFIDNSQDYTKGFFPSVTSQAKAPIAELYNSFGKYLNIKPISAQTADQGFSKYHSALRASFSNVEAAGQYKALAQACSDILGITTPVVREYHKQHWFKSDRETKMYVFPTAADYVWYKTGLATGADNNLIFQSIDSRYTSYIEYIADSNPLLPAGGTLTTIPAGNENPYAYHYVVRIKPGVTTAANVRSLFGLDPVASIALGVTPSGLDTGVINEGLATHVVRMHTLGVAWEPTALNMYSRKYLLQDSVGSGYVETSKDATSSVTISSQSPNNTLPATIPDVGTAPWLNSSDPGIANIVDALTANPAFCIVARDDLSEGVQAPVDGDPIDPNHLYVTGNKRMLFKLNISSSGFTYAGTRYDWMSKAILRIYVHFNSAPGYLKLYRVRRKYNVANVCWNFRNKVNVPQSGGTISWSWDGTAYNTVGDVAGQDWVMQDWATDGAGAVEDAVFLKEFYIPAITIDPDTRTYVGLDITDVLQQIFKYENHRPDMGDDPENIFETGFMFTGEGLNNRSLMVIGSVDDATYKPVLVWQTPQVGFHTCTPNSTTYFYTDGVTRWGRLITKQSNTEPISYVKTVHERIYTRDILYTDDIQITLATTPLAGMVAGAYVTGVDTVLTGVPACVMSFGKITKVVGNTLFVKTCKGRFMLTDVVCLMYARGTTTIAPNIDACPIESIAYTGDMYVTLSRTPVSTSLLAVRFDDPVGAGSPVADTPPETPFIVPPEYPSYIPWAEGDMGIAPVFIETPVGVLNEHATQDADDRCKIYLNISSTDLADFDRDVIVTYQYFYDFVLVGRATTDSDSVVTVDGCNRVDAGLTTQYSNDNLYKTELMLPQPVSNIPDISGDPTANEYSDYNLKILGEAVHNVRRNNGSVDVFKYGVAGNPIYQPGHIYHTFFERS